MIPEHKFNKAFFKWRQLRQNISDTKSFWVEVPSFWCYLSASVFACSFFPIHKILSLTPHNLLSEVYFLISNRKTLITHYHVSYFNTWWKCFVNCVQYLHNYVYNTTWCRVVYGLCTVISNNVFWELDISAKNLNQFRDLNVYCINGLRPSFPMKKLAYEGACLVLIHVACHWFENGDHHWTLNYWNLNYVLGAE